MGAEPETERLKEIGSRLARSSLSLTRYIATAGPGLASVQIRGWGRHVRRRRVASDSA